LKGLKKFVVAALSLVIVCFIVAGCGSGSTSATSDVTQPKFTNSNWAELSTDPDKFKNAVVNVTGQVFTTPEKDEDGTYFQMWADPKNGEYNTMIAYYDPSLEITQNDFVRITGTVDSAYTGENQLGVEITAPFIIADNVEKIDAQEILAPTKLLVNVNKMYDQHGLTISLNKIELADEETRLYVTVKNNTQDMASFYSSSTKATQGTNQFDEQINYEANYPEISYELLPGVVSSGMVILQSMDANVKSAKIFLDGSTDNYDLEFQPYIFDVVW